jgi:hypothetical protein
MSMWICVADVGKFTAPESSASGTQREEYHVGDESTTIKTESAVHIHIRSGNAHSDVSNC